jgi:hypothetical protein
MLTLMDGFEEDLGVLVIAATNASEDDLDSALLRSGRFDKKVFLQAPFRADRKRLFEFYLNKLPRPPSARDAEEAAEQLAGLSWGMSGADIANVCNQVEFLLCIRPILLKKKKKKIQGWYFGCSSWSFLCYHVRLGRCACRCRAGARKQVSAWIRCGETCDGCARGWPHHCLRVHSCRNSAAPSHRGSSQGVVFSRVSKVCVSRGFFGRTRLGTCPRT